MKRTLDLNDKELVLLYLLLRDRDCPHDVFRSHLAARVEQILFEFMTIDEVEHIHDYYRSLKPPERGGAGSP